MKLTASLPSLLVALFGSIALAASQTVIKDAKDFKAFHIGNLESGQAQIIFSRDVEDTVHDYVVYGYPAASGPGKAQRLDPMIPYDSNQPIAVVDPTAQGQHRLYLDAAGAFTLTPFQVNIKPGTLTLDTFYVESYQGSRMVKRFDPFTLTKEVVPSGSPSRADILHFDPSTGKGTASFSYDGGRAIANYIVLFGDVEQKIFSTIMTRDTTVNFQLPKGAKAATSQMTISAISTSGSVVSPTNCGQVLIMQ